MFTSQILQPPVDPTGITIIRLHHEAMDIAYLLELPGRHDEGGESYVLRQEGLEWWLDRMLELHGTQHHLEARRNRVIDYINEFHHAEFDFVEDKLVPLPNWPDPELREIRAHQNRQIKEHAENRRSSG